MCVLRPPGICKVTTHLVCEAVRILAAQNFAASDAKETEVIRWRDRLASVALGMPPVHAFEGGGGVNIYMKEACSIPVHVS